MNSDPQRIRPRRNPLIIGLNVVVVAALLWGVSILFTNPNFEWATVFQYLFNEQVLAGVVVTLWLTAVSMTLGIVLGTLLAVMRLSDHRVFRYTAGVYVWFFRGVPVLVQLIFWFNLASLFPTIDFGLPFMTPLFSLDANELITRTGAAILGLALCEAAYMAEIVRAGIESVGVGQREAASALGMSPWLTFRRVVLPQATRVIIPPTGNELINLLKGTSLVSVLAISDLLYAVQTIYSQNFLTIPLLITATVWYLAITSVLNVVQMRIERHFAAGISGRPRRTAPRERRRRSEVMA
jgi:polar amino acid transport system permease protein